MPVVQKIIEANDIEYGSIIVTPNGHDFAYDNEHVLVNPTGNYFHVLEGRFLYPRYYEGDTEN